MRGPARPQLPRPGARGGEGAGPRHLRDGLRRAEQGGAGSLRPLRSPEHQRRRAVPGGGAQPLRRGARPVPLRAARAALRRRSRPHLQGRSVGDRQQPRGVCPVKNGVGREHAGFTPWFWSYRLAARIEAVVVVCVIAGVVAILALLFRMPGPLVVHVQDDKKEAVMGARVRCTSPDRQSSHAGSTDVFGEAKWPGLARGPWTCEVTPPERFHADVQTGIVTVVARKPAMWTTVVERPARILVQVVRPQGQPRAKVAVRAVCGSETWEARAGLGDRPAIAQSPDLRQDLLGALRLAAGEDDDALAVEAALHHVPRPVGERLPGDVVLLEDLLRFGLIDEISRRLHLDDV